MFKRKPIATSNEANNGDRIYIPSTTNKRIPTPTAKEIENVGIKKSRINFNDVKPRTIIRYKNNINGIIYNGLVYSVTQGMANIVKITDDQNFANPQTKISSVQIYEDNKTAYANPFYCTSSVRLFAITEIVGTISDMEYFNIVSSMVNVYMGIYHVDTTGSDKKWVLDIPMVQNPIAAMLFGMCSAGEMRNRQEEKAKVMKEKADKKDIQEIEKEAHEDKPVKKRSTIRNQTVSVKKDAVAAMQKYNIFSMDTQKRIDAIWAFFSEYQKFDGRLNVQIIYDMMFDKDFELTTRRLNRTSRLYITKEEFANVLTMHWSDLANTVFQGSDYSNTKILLIKNVCNSIFTGEIVDGNSGKVGFSNQEIDYINDMIKKGEKRSTIAKTIYSKRLEEGNKKEKQNLQSVMKAVYRVSANSYSGSHTGEPYASKQDAFIGCINKRICFRSYPNVDSLIDVYVSEIEPNLSSYLDMSKVYYNEDTMLNIILVYATAYVNNVNHWITMFSNPAYRSLMERFDREINIHVLPSGTPTLNISCMIGIKMVAICSTMSDKDKEYLVSVRTDPLSVRKYFLSRCVKGLNKVSINVMKYIASVTGIDVDTISIAFNNKEAVLNKMKKQDMNIIPAED